MNDDSFSNRDPFGKYSGDEARRFQSADKDPGMVDNRLSILDYCLWQILSDVPPVQNELEWMDVVVSEALDRLSTIDNQVTNLPTVP